MVVMGMMAAITADMAIIMAACPSITAAAGVDAVAGRAMTGVAVAPVVEDMTVDAAQVAADRDVAPAGAGLAGVDPVAVATVGALAAVVPAVAAMGAVDMAGVDAADT